MTTRQLRHLVIGLVLGLGPVVAYAQAPADPTAYAVVYFEVAPTAASSISGTLSKYKAASRTEPGFVGMDALAQTGRPGHFILVESWRDQAAHDAHVVGPAHKAFREAFEAARVSGYDSRMYKTLAIAPPSGAADRQAVYVVSHVDIGGQNTDAPTILRTLAESSRKENGNLRFDVVQHSTRLNHFTVIEVWRNRQAQEAHAAGAYTKAYRDKLLPMTGSPLDERLFTSVE